MFHSVRVLIWEEIREKEFQDYKNWSFNTDVRDTVNGNLATHWHQYNTL